MMNTTKLLLIFLIIVNFKQVICSTLKDWRDSLNDYLSYELKKYQIIFIVENEKILRDFDLIDIFPNALSPSLMFTFEGIKEILSPENELLQNSAYTSFFILIFASEIIDYESISTFLVDLTNPQMRPKCLLIHLLINNNNNDNDNYYEELLYYFWTQQFADFTLLTPIVSSNVTPSGHLNSWRIAEFGQLHNFNIFHSGYRKELMEGKINWFPDKIDNLYQYPMNISGVYLEDVDFNSSDSTLLEIKGDLVLFKALSKVMNFKINFTQKTDFLYYRGCKKENYYYSAMRDLVYNEIQMITNYMIQPGRGCERGPFLTSHIISVEWITATVPRNRIVEKIIDMQHLFYIFIVNVCTLIGIMIVAFLLKFDKNTWNVFNIFLVILSMFTPSQPQRFREKIIFASLLLTSVVYSNYLHSALTNACIKKEYEVEINSLEDLVESNLTPMIDKQLRITAIHAFQNQSLLIEFLNKAELYSDQFPIEQCFPYMIEFKNISCFTEIRNPQLFEKNFAKNLSRVDAKIVPERWMPSLTVFLLEPGSMFAKRFNDILLRFLENGFIEKWNIRSKFNLYPMELIDQQIESFVILMDLLIIILIAGYVTSLIAFIIEIIVYFWKKNEKVLFKRRVCHPTRRVKRRNVFSQFMFFMKKKKFSVKFHNIKLNKFKLLSFKNCQTKTNLLHLVNRYFSKK